jgi:hypothetical protein
MNKDPAGIADGGNGLMCPNPTMEKEARKQERGWKGQGSEAGIGDGGIGPIGK